MAATMEIHEMSGADAGTDKTSGTIRFKDADNATVDTNNPLVVPAADTIYSYTKKLRAYMEDAPTTQVSNLRWYSDGTSGFGTGVAVTVKNIGTTFGTQYKTAMADGADLFGKTSAAPLDGDGTDAGPFVPADVDTYVGDIIELQMSVASTASHGALTAETLTFAYDEI
jgi:hypothetical protein